MASRIVLVASIDRGLAMLNAISSRAKRLLGAFLELGLTSRHVLRPDILSIVLESLEHIIRIAAHSG